MAKMIPEHITVGNSYKNDTDSEAEKIVFEHIKNNPRTKGWVVYHSLNLKNSELPYTTEADFVILVPDKGILVLEVKGGDILRKDGRFYSKDRYGKNNEIRPFEQLENQKYDLINYLETNGVDVLVVGGVSFSCRNFYNVSSPEFDTKQIFDFTSKKRDIYDYMLDMFDIDKSPKKKNGFSLATQIKVEKLIRPDIPVSKKTLKESIAYQNNYISSYATKIQEDILAKLQRESRAIIRGGAGTGKTFLAIELAKRLYDGDIKIGLFCYNIIFGEFLKTQFPKEKFPNIDAGAIQEWMVDYIKETGVQEKDFNPHELPTQEQISEYYHNTFYKDAREALLRKQLDYDVIIFDEAQDCMGDQMLSLLSLMLKKRLLKGKWFFFADFSFQIIFETSTRQKGFEQLLESFGCSSTDYVDIPLKENFRNSPKIVYELEKITGKNIYDENYHNEDADGVVEYKTYRNKEEEMEQLEQLLDYLLEEEQLEKKQITILGNDLFENTVASKCKYKDAIDRWEDCSEDMISYSRIRRFKGMENDVIILIDLGLYMQRGNQKTVGYSYLYTSLSRAKHSCYILENEAEKEKRLNEFYNVKD